MRMKYNSICILDTETTDLYWNHSAPIQIAAEIIDDQGRIIDTFNERIKTTYHINPSASEVHGIYAKDLLHCRPESAVLLDFCLWLKQYKVEAILTYNGEAFDRPLLNLRCQKLNIPVDWFDKTRFPGLDGAVDVRAAKKINLFGLKDSLGKGWKLSKTAEALGISAVGAHDALADVEMLRQVFFKLDPYINPTNWIDNTIQATSLF